MRTRFQSSSKSTTNCEQQFQATVERKRALKLCDFARVVKTAELSTLFQNRKAAFEIVDELNAFKVNGGMEI